VLCVFLNRARNSHCTVITTTIWLVVPAPENGWSWVWSNRWNKWQGKPKQSENISSSAPLSTTNTTWPDRGSNSGRGCRKLATDSPLWMLNAPWSIRGASCVRRLQYRGRSCAGRHVVAIHKMAPRGLRCGCSLLAWRITRIFSNAAIMARPYSPWANWIHTWDTCYCSVSRRRISSRLDGVAQDYASRIKVRQGTYVNYKNTGSEICEHVCRPLLWSVLEYSDKLHHGRKPSFVKIALLLSQLPA
jgi:hypothetical protein